MIDRPRRLRTLLGRVFHRVKRRALDALPGHFERVICRQVAHQATDCRVALLCLLLIERLHHIGRPIHSGKHALLILEARQVGFLRWREVDPFGCCFALKVSHLRAIHPAKVTRRKPFGELGDAAADALRCSVNHRRAAHVGNRYRVVRDHVADTLPDRLASRASESSSRHRRRHACGASEHQRGRCDACNGSRRSRNRICDTSRAALQDRRQRKPFLRHLVIEFPVVGLVEDFPILAHAIARHRLFRRQVRETLAGVILGTLARVVDEPSADVCACGGGFLDIAPDKDAASHSGLRRHLLGCEQFVRIASGLLCNLWCALGLEQFVRVAHAAP